MSDTTPPIAMSFMDRTIDLDCGLCFEIQRFHCFSQVCPSQTSPFFVCDPRMDADMCMGEQTALQDCLRAIPDGSAQAMMLESCFNNQVIACFDTSGGFLPTAAARFADFARFTPREAPGLSF